jgi:mRNA-degrading endonuclease toxin of MazEF toxin-antitoxin module
VTEARRGDVVLVGFPFVGEGGTHRKRRPALVVQADRYNRGRAALILAPITTSGKGSELRCKVPVALDPAGRRAGLRTDSIIDCQTLVTIPRTEIVAKLGRIGPDILLLVDRALMDALGLG